MTPGAIKEVTEERFQQLVEDSKTKRTGSNNTSISTFHDSVSNLKALENKVCICSFSTTES